MKEFGQHLNTKEVATCVYGCTCIWRFFPLLPLLFSPLSFPTHPLSLTPSSLPPSLPPSLAHSLSLCIFLPPSLRTCTCTCTCISISCKCTTHVQCTCINLSPTCSTLLGSTKYWRPREETDGCKTATRGSFPSLRTISSLYLLVEIGRRLRNHGFKIWPETNLCRFWQRRYCILVFRIYIHV